MLEIVSAIAKTTLAEIYWDLDFQVAFVTACLAFIYLSRQAFF